METVPQTDQKICKHSVEEGLDFACSLLSGAMETRGIERPEEASELLSGLTQYVRLRYHGEPELALEWLASLAHKCSPEDYRQEQFWSQLQWIAQQMGLSDVEFSGMGGSSAESPGDSAYNSFKPKPLRGSA